MYLPRLAFFASLSLSWFVGCTTTSTTPASDAGAGKSAALTCAEIFACAASCPDDPCAEACLTSGSAAGKTAANAVVVCYQTNACGDAGADPSCLKAKCTAELQACTTQQAAPDPTATPPAAGVVPASLVAEWDYFYSPTDHLDKFTFAASGGAKRYQTTSSTFGGCANSAINDATGTVVFTDTKMTYYQTGGTDLWSTCGGAGTPNPTPKGAYEYLWSLDGTGRLVLTSLDSSCTGTPSSSSCTKAYDKK